MKKLSIILACFLVAMMSCTKSKEVHPEIGDGNDEIVTVGVKDVHVEYTRTDHVELSKVVFHYCPVDANGNAQQFEVAEMTKKETFFELTLDNLLSDTLYWYYYELFPNGGDAFTTVQKTFHTQAFEQPEPPTPPSGAPEGAINGLFTINANGDQVYFSQGNLQYQASTNTWRFAEHQWDYVGDDTYGTVYVNGVKCDNTLTSSTYNGWIDLFGWATSGYNHGSDCYLPWSISDNSSNYYAYGSSHNNLFDQNGQADWGYNKIINGGNDNNMWRTTKHEEWNYVFNLRNTPSGIRYAKATIDGVFGIVLFPDDWNVSYYQFNEVNMDTVSFGSNIISTSNWNELIEVKGAVFLPAAGLREGLYYSYHYLSYGALGDYWSSSYYNDNEIYGLGFNNLQMVPNGHNFRWCGRTIRLVQNTN